MKLPIIAISLKNGVTVIGQFYNIDIITSTYIEPCKRSHCSLGVTNSAYKRYVRKMKLKEKLNKNKIIHETAWEIQMRL